MALDETPGVIVTRTRDQIRDQYLADYQLRIPTADVGPDTLPYVDASGLADAEMVLVNDAVVIGRGGRRIAEADADMAGIVAFLLGPEAGYITGHNLLADGGLLDSVQGHIVGRPRTGGPA